MASNPNAPAQGNMTDAERARADGTATAGRGRTAERAATAPATAPAGETDTQRRERERREADERRTADRARADANANRNAATTGRVERGPDGNTTRIGDREVRRAGGRPAGEWPFVQTSAEARNLGADVTRDVAGNTGSMYMQGGPGAPQPGSREANDAAVNSGNNAGAPTTGDGSTTTGTTGVGAAAPAGGTAGDTGGAR